MLNEVKHPYGLGFSRRTGCFGGPQHDISLVKLRIAGHNIICLHRHAVSDYPAGSYPKFGASHRSASSIVIPFRTA